ncbi:MAG: hypothetical protein NTY36_15790 [Deltaproteobacteria bacterium]|nr:hypothetical protein [Deltaproteobacteria bacterium]
MKKIIWLMVTSLLLLQACIHHQTEIGKKIDSAKIDQIIDGKTTESEAVALLGEPQRVTEAPNGIKVIGYQYYQSQMYSGFIPGQTKGDITSQMLMLWVKNGVVVKKSGSTANMPTGSQTGKTLVVPDKFK